MDEKRYLYNLQRNYIIHPIIIINNNNNNILLYYFLIFHSYYLDNKIQYSVDNQLLQYNMV